MLLMISSELRTLNKSTCHTGAKDARIESRADVDASLNISWRSNMFKFIIFAMLLHYIAGKGL